MNETAIEDVQSLLKRSARIKLFIVLRRTVNPALIPEHLLAHLRWVIELERAGKVFLSGPVTNHDPPGFDGMTLLRVGSRREAEDLIRQDPFVVATAMEVELHEWTVNEGGMALFVTISDSGVAFGG